MGIQLTEAAANAVKTVIEENDTLDIEDTHLRVGVKGGGCSGFTYSLDITNTKNEEDEIWSCGGVSVICDPRSFLYLDGTEIDYIDDLMQSGFVFKNPNSTSQCGCGSSFNAQGAKATKIKVIRDPNSEVVHHIDGDKANNKLSNLQVITQAEHSKCHAANDGIVLELYKRGLVEYSRRKKKYHIKDL